MKPILFIIIVMLLIFVGGFMIQTGLSTLAGEGGAGYFSVVPTLSIDDFNLPSRPQRSTSNSSGSSGGGSSDNNNQNVNTNIPKNLPSWIDATKISPYFREIRLTSLRAGSRTSQGYAVLKSSSNRSEKINITGWQIKAKNGGVFVPKAVELYNPSGFNQEVDIRLGKGDQLTMYTMSSPIGQNLRLNKCIGYLQSETRISPAFPRQCPRPNVDEVRAYSSQCIDYVRTISSCEVPESNPPIPDYDYQCREFLKQFTYQGCYSKHIVDSDFLSSQWRAWVGGVFVDPRHDRILLLDNNGSVVDYREY